MISPYLTRYNAIGPRRDTFLSFERGDEISITKDSDQEWWEVKCLDPFSLYDNYLNFVLSITHSLI